VISDQNMPEMTGLELRTALGDPCSVPFVLLTGHAERSELDHHAGFELVDEFLTKPVPSAQFDAVLDRFFTTM
jgi:CheY-like chemotaxis protein